MPRRRSPARSSAPTRSPSASTRTSPPSAAPSRWRSSDGRVADIRLGYRRHGGDAEARARLRAGADRPAAGPRRRVARGAAGARRGFRADLRHAGERRLSPAGGAQSAAQVPARDRRPAAARRGCAPAEASRRDAAAPAARPCAGAARRTTAPSSMSRGTALYIDDMPEPRDLLHAYIRLERAGACAHHPPRPRRASAAAPGVAAVMTARDLPAANDIGPVAAGRPRLRRRTSSSIAASRCSRSPPTASSSRARRRGQGGGRVRGAAGDPRRIEAGAGAAMPSCCRRR